MRLPSLRVIFSLAVALAGLAGIAPALALQSPECRSLQSQIASLSRGDPGRSATYGRAAQKQRAELDRTAAYASSIGCSKRQFLIFGAAPPPQCSSIEGQMQRMRANLSQLEAQAGGGGDESAIRDLTYRYNNRCRATAPAQVASAAPQPQRGLFDQLFGGGQPRRAVNEPPPFQPQQLEQVPLERPVQSPLDDSEEETSSGSRGGSRAVCVRKCDGGFFPVSYSARGRNLDGLADLCHALCPNADVGLFTLRAGADIETAVSPDGEPYTELPNALKYQKTYDPTCSCKAAGKSWVETLAEAEKVLGRQSRTDILVTQKKADEMARPKVDPRKRPDAAARPIGDDPTATVLPAAAPKLADAGDGEFNDIAGPDGIKRRVRVIKLKQ